MIDRARFAINRITCPSLGLEDFFRFTKDLGLSHVEVRNDLPGGAITDGMPPAQALDLARKHGIGILTINGLQKFNLKSREKENLAELEKMLEVASALKCAAVVMCPNNDSADRRDARSRLEETVSGLQAYGPAFTRAGVQGWVEPLGFTESSLSSVVVAVEAVKKSGFGCYRVVFDTFHHFLGPDTEKDIDADFARSRAGLIHVSGVEAGTSKETWRDGARVLVSSADRMASKKQIDHLISLGYQGLISFEPFAAEVQKMSRDELASALRRSIDYLSA
ncbi:MAG TPA: TIM barrel protein [Spirochaetia bacterium]|nr:TIM barrel protein [Spirochaetia bacterium]